MTAQTQSAPVLREALEGSAPSTAADRPSHFTVWAEVQTRSVYRDLAATRAGQRDRAVLDRLLMSNLFDPETGVFARVSSREMAKELGIPRRTLERALGSLVGCGLLVKIPFRRDGHRLPEAGRPGPLPDTPEYHLAEVAHQEPEKWRTREIESGAPGAGEVAHRPRARVSLPAIPTSSEYAKDVIESPSVSEESRQAERAIARLESKTRPITEPMRSVLRVALVENRSGVIRCWKEAVKRGNDPLRLLLRMIQDGDHRLPEIHDRSR